ncbi:General substrate transporter [Penicillium concentricum]|uniref:General substrate transporter n=1 Tax=Penicillium concentricum TaxID=293559 RepID=A0A9W9R901_9EURO|nr:General substrate transporter [Penicillium concentricum]KAJ5355922.1 General substrate transporter [Penicillium concentricum]
MGIAVGASTLQSDLDATQAARPELEKVNWWQEPGLRRLYCWAAVLCVASATTGYDGMMLNTSQNLDAWQVYFDHPNGAQLGLMNAIYQIGSLASFPFVPFIADRWGRKIPIMIGCVLMIVGGLLGAFCTNYGMYVAGRLLLGFGNSLAQMASPVLLTEICHPQHRGKVTSIYNCLWNLGALLVAWLAWGTMYIPNDWSWRSLTLLQILPAVIQIVFIYWVPESPRWLVSKERYEDALDILAYYHGNGDKKNATVQFEYREIKETISLEMRFQKNSSYLDFCKTKGNRYRLALLISLGVISQYSGNALFSNYTNLIYNSMGITEQTKKIPLNGGQTLLSLVVSVSSAFFVDRVGRRPLFLVSTIGMVLMFLAWTVVSSVFEKTGDVATTGYPQVVFVWLFSVFYAIAWSGLLVAYSLEILPYRLRAKGVMIMNLTVQASLVLGNYTNPIAWENLPHHWNLSMIYTIWIFIELCFVYFFYVETRGPTLEELAKIFDGEDADVAHVDLQQVEKEIAITEKESPEYRERA